MIPHRPVPQEALEALVRSAAPTEFTGGFADRVLSRMRDERTIATTLQRQFVRIVPIAAAASLLLAAHNWWGGRHVTNSTIEAALNLPPVTLATAYTPVSLYGTVVVPTETP